MNKRNLMLLGFVVVAVVQLAVPAWMILEREWTLREGQVFKFKTKPVDPADAFRGRYVLLSLEPDTVTDVGAWNYGQKAFAVLGTGPDGFAIVKRLERTQPSGENALQVSSMWSDGKGRRVHISWRGLDRYYMTEDKAPAAETAYRAHNRGTNQTCFITVRVRGSVGVIENLYIDNQPIQVWLKDHKGK